METHFLLGDTWNIILLLFSIFIVAFLYASIGHGGASGYITVLTIIGFSSLMIKPSALILNIIVSLISFLSYYKIGEFSFKKFYPFVLLSIPAAFLGGYITLPEFYFKKILGICLLISIFRILMENKNEKRTKEIPFIGALFSGLIIGFLSGLIGIGGGVILTPLLLLLNWANLKQAAAISALFIFINSISGLIGLKLSNNILLPTDFIFVLISAILGGILGSYFGSQKFNNKILKYFLTLALIIASFKLFVS